MTAEPIGTIWGESHDVTWDNAPENIKESFALVRLFWFFRMIDSGGPDGSELDALVADEAREAAEWLGPILHERAERAES
jgi:hypothetical protein